MLVDGVLVDVDPGFLIHRVDNCESNWTSAVNGLPRESGSSTALLGDVEILFDRLQVYLKRGNVFLFGQSFSLGSGLCKISFHKFRLLFGNLIFLFSDRGLLCSVLCGELGFDGFSSSLVLL